MAIGNNSLYFNVKIVVHMLSKKSIALSLVSLLLSFTIVNAQTPRTFLSVETFAGSLNSTGSTNGPRLDARFNGPVDMVYDDMGNLYIAEQFNHVIRIMSPEGIVSDFVGLSGTSGFQDGTGINARFNEIRGITLDNDGNIIVADKENHAVRKVTPAGEVTTLAGTGTSGFMDGVGASAMFLKPNEVLVDPDGDIFVADTGNNRVRKIDSKGMVSTLIGLGTAGYEDGNITQATLSNPAAIGFDSSGNLIVTVRRGLRRYDFATGEISTITGGPDATVFQDGDKDTAGFDSILGLLVDEGDVFYIVERHAIRHVSLDGFVTTLSGAGFRGASNGAPLDARYHFPRGIVKTPDGDFLIADRANQNIRRILTESGNFRLTSSTPADNSKEFNSNEVTLTFSEEVFVGRGTISIYDASTDTPVRRVGVIGSNVSVNGNTATISIGKPLPRNRSFYLEVTSTAFKNSNDDFFDGITDKTILSFSSATDLALTNTAPLDNATEFGGTTITLTFNRNIEAGRGRISVRDAATDMEITGTGVNSSRLSIIDNVVTLDLIKPLPVNKQVYLRIPGASFKDVNGIQNRAILDKTTLNFSTVTFTELLLTSSTPMDDAIDFNAEQISLTFNRNIVAGRGRLVLFNADNDQRIFSTGVSSNRVTISANVLTMDLPTALPASMNVYLKVPGSALMDADGIRFKGILDKTTLNFMTSEEDEPSTRRNIDINTEDGFSSQPDASISKQVSVYPNPASNSVSFDLSQLEGSITFSIVDMTGNAQFTKENIKNSTISIDVTNYSNGLYIARILQSNGLTITKKLMIKH